MRPRKAMLATKLPLLSKRTAERNNDAPQIRTTRIAFFAVDKVKNQGKEKRVKASLSVLAIALREQPLVPGRESNCEHINDKNAHLSQGD
jgi:hypothetical protein